MKNQARQRRHTQTGSIFFWLFFMVFLFGVLSYAMTQGFRGGTAAVTREQARLAAAEIVSYMQSVRSAVKELEIQNGCSITQINFSTPVYIRETGARIDNNAPGTSAPCTLYGSEGGNIRPVVFNGHLSPLFVPTSGDWTPGHFGARYMNVSGVGTAENDLFYFMKGLQPEICIAAMNLLAGEARYDEVPVDSDSWGSSSNSWTPGNSYSSFDVPNESLIVAFRPTDGTNYCLIGIVLKPR